MKYSAFISYNFKDRRAASALHKKIEDWRPPKSLADSLRPSVMRGDRLLPVFRDRDELAAAANLSQAVQDALAASDSLVVICSPNGAQSKWVNEEIRTFRALGKGERIFCYVINGDPGSDDPKTRAFPPALTEDGSAEPLAADARSEQDGERNARLKVIAGIAGVGFDALRQRDYAQRVRRLTLAASVATFAFVITAGLAVFAYIQRNEAVAQRNLADERAITAERTVQFVKDMFRQSDPSQALGETITAREVLDQGAALLEVGLDNEPGVKAELGITLADVYSGLGLYQRSQEIAFAAAEIDAPRLETKIKQLTALGESYSDLYEDEKALEYFKSALRLQTDEVREPLKSQIQFGYGQTQTFLRDYEQAEAALIRAIEIDRGRGPDGQTDLGRDLLAMSNLMFLLGNYSASEDAAKEAAEIFQATQGSRSPDLGTARNNLAAIALRQRQFANAEKIYRSILALDEEVLKPGHPRIASTSNNLGRALIEQRKFREARPLIEQANSVIEKNLGATGSPDPYVTANLAIVRREAGRMNEAKALFAESISDARAQDHPVLAPSMVDLAELECNTGQTAEGLDRLSMAATIMPEVYPEQSWRMDWLKSVQGACLWNSGQREAGRELVNASTQKLIEEWDASTMVGQAARARRQRVR